MTTNTMITKTWREKFEAEKKEIIEEFNKNLYEKNVIHSELQKIVLHRDEKSPYIKYNLPIATSKDQVVLKDITFNDSYIFITPKTSIVTSTLLFDFHGEEVLMETNVGIVDVYNELYGDDFISPYIYPLDINEAPCYVVTEDGLEQPYTYIADNKSKFLEMVSYDSNGKSFNEDEHDSSIALFNVLKIHELEKFDNSIQDLLCSYICSVVEEKAKVKNINEIEEIKINNPYLQTVGIKFKGYNQFFEMKVREFYKEA